MRMTGSLEASGRVLDLFLSRDLPVRTIKDGAEFGFSIQAAVRYTFRSAFPYWKRAGSHEFPTLRCVAAVAAARRAAYGWCTGRNLFLDRVRPRRGYSHVSALLRT